MPNDVIFSNKRTQCNVCNSKHSKATITKYFDFDVSKGNYFKCFSCGTTITPKGEKITDYKPFVKSTPTPEPPKYNIDELFNYSISRFGDDNFTKYLINVWGAENECIESYLRTWFIGSDSNKNTVYWYLNERGKPFYFKLMQYDYSTCKRKKGDYTVMYGMYKNGDYIGTKDAGGNNGLFGLHTIKDKNDIIVVESEKTAILSSFYWSQYGFVATGGAKNFSQTMINQLKNKNIFLCFDNDEAGIKANNEHSQTLKRQGIKHSILPINTLVGKYGTDLADYILSKENGFYAE